MGDLSAEPSMEDILSSIKRIIAEEGEPAPAPARAPRAQRSLAPPPRLAPDDDEDAAPGADEVLELNDPMPQPAPPAPRPDPAPAAAEPILSTQAAAATRGSLDALSRLMVKPDPAGDGTLEGLVRELLRPMLREWLDAHLPEMVEAMVAREIKRITGQGG